MSETTVNEAARRPWASLAKADEPYSHFEAWVSWLEKMTGCDEITAPLDGEQSASLYAVMCDMADRAEKAEREREMAIEAGAKIMGQEAASNGYASTNTEDRAEFLWRAGLES